MVFSLSGSPFKLTPQDMGGFDLFGAINSGLNTAKNFHETRNLPKKLAEELLAQQLANKINTPKANHAEEITMADLQGRQGLNSLIPLRQKLLEAQARAAMNPKPIPGKISQLEQLRDRYSPGSADYNKYDEALSNALKGSNGTQLSVDPETGAVSFSQGGYGRSAPSSQITTDAEGNTILVNKPTQATSTATQKASSAEIGRGLIAQRAEMPYIGSGSNIQLAQDRINYTAKGDKEAGKRLVKAAVASMLVPEYAGLQLAAQNVPATIPALEHQQNTITQGWPIDAKLILNNLPKELQQEAKIEHAKVLKEIKEAKELNAAQGYPIKLKKALEKMDNKIKKIDTSKYDIPEGSIILYKNGEGYAFPSELVDQKLEEGYSYE